MTVYKFVPPTPEEDVLAEWTQNMARDFALDLEQHLRLVIKPRPRWLPHWIWRKVIGTLVNLEVRR